jgi:hypothetical protein
MRVFLLFMSFLCGLAAEEDAYESRVGTDFVEQTTFRFRTKFNRAFIEEEFNTLISRRVDVPPLLDGVLEDPCWRTADHSKGAFLQWMSKDVSRKQTVIYVCHDDENLYMAIVAEEPTLKAVQMPSHHPGAPSWVTAGNNDSIETFIEMGGVGGVGQVFQFIYNIYPEVRYDGLYPPYVPFIGTGYKLGGAFGAKCWIVELAFPHKGFNTEKTKEADYRYEGPPRRGEVWGLRVVRNGPRPDRGGDQMRSTWTYNPTNSWHVPYPTGIIVFEDRNALHNGKMNQVEPATSQPLHWTLAKAGEDAKAEFGFDEKAGQATLAAKLKKPEEAVQITQKFGVLPNVGYKLTARVRKGEGKGKVCLGVPRPLLTHEFTKTDEWEEHVVDFFSEPKQREASVYLRLTDDDCSALIDEIRVEQQIYGAPTGAICLTGNSPREDLNLTSLTDKDGKVIGRELIEKVKYTYLEPGTDKEEFPYRKQWTPGWIHGQPDAGGTTGWIPATRGTLTVPRFAAEMVQWSHARPSAGYVPYPKGHEIVFDLGQEYYVRSVELLPGSAIENMTVQVMAEGGKKYVLTRKLRGEGVLNPTGPVLFGSVRRIDSVCRYVKIWFGDGGHTVYFLRIWGEEKKGRTGINRFRWKEGLVVPEEKYRQFRKLPGPVLMPTPQEVEEKPGEFVVKDGIPVYYRDEGRGAKVKDSLVNEVRATFGVSLRPVLETGRETPADGKGAIVLGEYPADNLARKMAQARGWKIDDKRPGIQGYFLSSSPDGVLICGYDQDGTFYGVQTLLQLLVRRDWVSAAAKAMEIRDWPYIPVRMLDCRGGMTLPMVRALARLKVNYVMSGHPAMEDHFMGASPGSASHGGGSPAEMDDDENWHYLGCGLAGYMRVNACPSHFQRYEFYEGAGRREFAGRAIGDININTDEMDGTDGGSRWNADRRCLVREKTGDELFTEMVIRAYDLFRLYNRKTGLLDTMMVAEFEGGNGGYNDMYKAYDRIPEDIHVFCWKGIVGDQSSDPEEAVRRFERATMLQSHFPHPNRGKLNECFRPPPGKRVWGSWNTVWGAAGPLDQVLTGQFCREMTMVDGGMNIAFMCQAWNPDSPPVHTDEWALKIGHLQQRFGEIVLETELPSWRDGVTKDYFKVDMRPACNWSHLDPEPGDGKDWLDWGPNNDLSRMPRGDVVFEEVPFHILDPATNQGKSIIMVAEQPKGARLEVPNESPEIPVGRQAASLIFLRGNAGGGHAPGYRITYEGGGFLTVPLEAMGNLSSGYSCYGFYPADKVSNAGDKQGVHFRSARHLMTSYFSLFFRLGWIGTTGAGDPVKMTIHEWVNPYPERKIESVSVRYPPGRKTDRIEALLAVTSVAPVERDFALWKDRKRLPLVAPNQVKIEPTDVPVIPPEDGQWAEKATVPTYLDKDGNKVCEISGLWVIMREGLTLSIFERTDAEYTTMGGSLVLTLANPVVCKKVALQGMFFWEYHGPKVHYGVSTFRRTDYIVEVSSDGKTWTKVGEKQGICGEDGPHVHALPPTPIQYVRVSLDGKSFIHERNPGASSGPGLTWLQLFR